MNKLYFTALIPASDIDTKVKRFRTKCQILHPLPPIVPLAKFNKPLEKREFKGDINMLDEIETIGLSIDNGWLVESIDYNKIPDSLLSDPLPLGLDRPSILIGRTKSLPVVEEYPGSKINNCFLGFYELTFWDRDKPFNNIELELIWKIKKKRVRTRPLVEGESNIC